MTRIAGASVMFALVVAAAGCGVGGGGGGTGGGDDGSGGGTYVPPDDKIVCSAHFTITGKFTAGAEPRPTDPDTNQPLDGCWPVGQWDFKAVANSDLQAGEKACATAPSVLPSYSFKVVATTDQDGTVLSTTSLTTAEGMQSHVTVSSNGQGCIASFEFGSADGTDYWNMQPTLAKAPGTVTIAGTGDYMDYSVNAWPWTNQ